MAGARPARVLFEATEEVPAGTEALGVPVWSDLSSPPGVGAVLDRTFLRRSGFEGRPGDAQLLPADDGSTVVALGVGSPDSLDGEALRRAGAAFARTARASSYLATTLPLAQNGSRRWHQAVVEGIGLGAYRYAGGHAKNDGSEREIRVAVMGASRAEVQRGAVSVEATRRSRDWVNLPAGQLTPSRLATETEEVGAAAGVAVEVWDEQRIAAEGLGGLAGVAAGSATPPRLIKLLYEPGDGRVRTRANLAFVGKGITFDSGGLSLKTAGSMMTMKSDMSGAAAVINSVVAASRLRLPVRITGWVAATENMPSGTAIHPGDVLTARNGVTMEVLNTDAEGRLVLADALSLAVEEGPDAIVDIATLTGGQRVALGDSVAAVLGNDDALVQRVLDAGAGAGEPAWRLPLVAAYRRDLDSDVADVKNITNKPGASTIIGGLFLQEFVGGRRWAHLDIAAPAWAEVEDGWLTKGATGWGTRTLIELAAGWR